MEQKVNAAGISIAASFALTMGKIAAGLVTGSAGLFASGIQSGLDFLAAVLSYSSVNQAKKPADEDHRYGHGKFESVAAVVEALLILMAVVIIGYKAIPEITGRGQGINHYEIGIAVAGVSSLVNFAVSGMLSGAYRRTMSPAFRADRRHLLVNAVASGAVCLGLAAVKISGLTVVDAFLAGVVSLVLLKEGYSHLRISAGNIVDVRLSEEEEGIIINVLEGHRGRYVQYHALRTRRSGSDLYVDLHLVVPRDQVIAHTHEICDNIEKDILARLPGANILIHPEPCRPVSGECGNCGIDNKLSADAVGTGCQPGGIKKA